MSEIFCLRARIILLVTAVVYGVGPLALAQGPPGIPSFPRIPCPTGPGSAFESMRQSQNDLSRMRSQMDGMRGAMIRDQSLSIQEHIRRQAQRLGQEALRDTRASVRPGSGEPEGTSDEGVAGLGVNAPIADPFPESGIRVRQAVRVRFGWGEDRPVFGVRTAGAYHALERAIEMGSGRVEFDPDSDGLKLLVGSSFMAILQGQAGTVREILPGGSPFGNQVPIARVLLQGGPYSGQEAWIRTARLAPAGGTPSGASQQAFADWAERCRLAAARVRKRRAPAVTFDARLRAAVLRVDRAVRENHGLSPRAMAKCVMEGVTHYWPTRDPADATEAAEALALLRLGPDLMLAFQTALADAIEHEASRANAVRRH